MPDLRPRPFSIRIFLPDGDPDGLRIVGKSNWTGVGVVFKRSGYHRAARREEFQRTGVYVLVGTAEESSQPIIYVGEGDPVERRISAHQRAKDFWDWAVFFVTKDGSLNKAHVRYLEHRLLELAKATKQAKLDNKQPSLPPTLSEAEQADMESFLADILSILPLVNLPVFEKPESARGATVLKLRGRGASASGYESPSGFVVKKGSRAAGDEVPSVHDYLRTMRQDLLEQGVLQTKDGYFLFSQDHPFNSPSTAAGVVLGRSANGRVEWKDKNGRTLKDIQVESAAVAASIDDDD